MAWLERTLSGTETVGFAWAVLLGFVRISTKGTFEGDGHRDLRVQPHGERARFPQ